MNYRFEYDERLGIKLPHLLRDWETLPADERHAMIMEWEQIKARIPDRIMDLEKQIEAHQDKISKEEDWDTVCLLYGELYSIASIINDLHIWSRVNQDFAPE